MKKLLFKQHIFCILILIGSTSLAFTQEKEIKDSTDILLIWKYGQKGFEYLNYNINLDSAEYFLNKAIDLAYATSDYPIDDRMAENYINLASLYR